MRAAVFRSESRNSKLSGSGAGLLCLYLIFSPVWLPSIAPRMYDNARILELTALCLLSLFALVPAFSRSIGQAWLGLTPLARWLLAIFVIGGVFSALASDAKQVGIQQIALNVQLLALCLMVCAIVRNQGAAVEKALAVAIFAGAGLVVLKFWVTYVLYFLDGKVFSWVSPFMDFANVRFFGQYQAYTLLLMLLPVAVMDLKGLGRYLVYFVAANFWAMQWMVGARAVWVGFAVAMVATAIALPQKRLQWIASQVAPALIGGLIFGLFTWLIQDSPKATRIPAINSVVERSGESDRERITLARSALELIAEHPLVGVGPGQFGMHYRKSTAAHPHNSPLQLLVEYGIAAGAAAIALGGLLVAYALRQIRLRSRQKFDAPSTILGAALIMGLVDALFSGNLIMPYCQVFLCVVAGWMLGRQRPVPSTPYVPAARQRQLEITLAGTAVLAALVTAVLAIEYVSLIREMPYPPALRIPSFWQYGRFSAW
jgi:O-antigen ligase